MDGRMRQAVGVVVVLAAGLALAAAAPAGRSAARSDWFWSPGICKSTLINYGVKTGDGRFFRADDARCIGRVGCIIRSHARLYSDFAIALVDRVGVVRTGRLHVTGKDTSTIASLTILNGVHWASLVKEIDAGVKVGTLKPLDPSKCKG